MNAPLSSSCKSYLLFLALIFGIYFSCKPTRYKKNNENLSSLQECNTIKKTSTDSLVDLSNLNGKNTCLPEIIKSLQMCLKESMGSERYDQFSTNNGIVSISIVIDTLGNVKQLNSYRLKNISEDEFKKFYQTILKNIKFCVYVYDRSLSYKEILKYSKNRINYTLHVK